MNNELYRGFRADKTKERIENKNDIVSGFYHRSHHILSFPACSLVSSLHSNCLHNAHALLFTAYDFTSSDLKHYNMVLQYNPDESNVLRVPRLMNLVMFVS